MTDVKKWAVRLGGCLLLVFLLGLLNYVIAPPMYYRLFYPWDRYTGTVSVELDGEPAAFSLEADPNTKKWGDQGQFVERALDETADLAEGRLSFPISW